MFVLEIASGHMERIVVVVDAGSLHHPTQVSVRLSDVAGGRAEAGVVHAPLSQKLRICQLSRCRGNPVLLEDPTDPLPIRV